MQRAALYYFYHKEVNCIKANSIPTHYMSQFENKKINLWCMDEL